MRILLVVVFILMSTTILKAAPSEAPPFVDYKRHYTEKEWKNRTVNISSQTLTALSEVYDIMAGISDDRQEIEVINDKKSIDVVSNRRAFALGWKPEYSIEEGLAQTLSYFREVEAAS